MDGNADVYACQRTGDGGSRKRGESEFDAEEIEEFGSEEGREAERIGFADDTEGGRDFAWKMNLFQWAGLESLFPCTPSPQAETGIIWWGGAAPHRPRLKSMNAAEMR